MPHRVLDDICGKWHACTSWARAWWLGSFVFEDLKGVQNASKVTNIPLKVNLTLCRKPEVKKSILF
jgi:hypothetical protein